MSEIVNMPAAVSTLDLVRTPTTHSSFGAVDDEVTSDDDSSLSAHHKHPAATRVKLTEEAETSAVEADVDDGDSTPTNDEHSVEPKDETQTFEAKKSVALPEHLRLLQERIASEKKRLRLFIIQTKEKREKEEQQNNLGEGPDVADINPSPSSETARYRNTTEIDGGEQPISGLEEGEEPEEGEQEEDEEEEDDFDMFNPDDAPTKKRKRVGGIGARETNKRRALNPTLRAVDSYDDHEGYYLATANEMLNQRYRIIPQSIGKGVFSAVYRCVDEAVTSGRTSGDKVVAVKIVRRNDLMRKAGEKEMEILKLLNSDPKHHRHIVTLKDVFMHRNHLCLVFENLALDMRQYMKRRATGKERGLSLLVVAYFARQLMVALRHMKKHRIIHADIKPDNILIDEKHSTLKVCDLGSAFDISENEITAYLVSRYYRAPEIVLGCKYDYAVDMWSTACTLFEIATGNFLFTGRNNSELLHDIMKSRGRFSNKFLRSAKFLNEYFCENLMDYKLKTVDWNLQRVSKVVSIAPKPTKSVQDRLNAELPALPPQASAGRVADHKLRVKNFADFLDKALCLDPARRLTPDTALKHPFLLQGLMSSATSGSRTNGQ
eukprot:Blabericola_migrator_1__2488@NODE_16_length_23467_cov_90_205256_g13_i0_p5_GENE_NODE_16_length_23467_cov_90_205256_g13_i0NODE_16_length_23467_cov_90_205256_g13_i0_p5_ORF_typecomplete_len605_score113_16Pkinase/PF00069_25/1_9e57Pkinase_Tyr/PF07714_17/5_8e32Kinaselike/PF14531_6/1_2e13RIO1/PF01163_22/2_4e06Kdo/PF06293_14/5e06Pkinase_fungal/PF17667_1/4_7e06Pox_serthr_kin/PF05445_11/0_0021APH/PF01636_23/0_0039YrbLPhoP_reg/PF10707_9/5_5e03YrbLPhoP_reg/PF10707_9/0_0076WaaY/PF06176_11/0_0086PIP49_C/PF1226